MRGSLVDFFGEHMIILILGMLIVIFLIIYLMEIKPDFLTDFFKQLAPK